MSDNDLELERQQLVVVKAGRTDTAPCTCLQVPSIGQVLDRWCDFLKKLIDS
jgi:hypothetical protein